MPLGVTLRPGRFGRMFGHLPRHEASDEQLEALAMALVDDPTDTGLNNAAVPAGYTYFAQFVDHDITFDPTPIPEQRVDPLAIFNFRTPKLDLDSVYGLGPADQPYLYERGNRGKFLLGINPESPSNRPDRPIPALRNDLPRNTDGFALIGDPRNDENLLVAQLHVAFLKFHNAVLEHLESDPAKQPARFEEARRLVTWHYQWIVLYDFLERVVMPNSVRGVLERGRSFYHYDRAIGPYMPVEFSVAAYRFGHSMVRNGYNHNRLFNSQPGALGPATLERLFFFTGPTKNGAGLPSSAPVPSNWAIDWRRFFDLGGSTPQTANKSRHIDPFLSPELHDLAKHSKVEGAPVSLAARNLVRGLRVGLPSGQRVAAAMGMMPLTPEALGTGSDGAAAKEANLVRETPLWYYLLKEASLIGEGRRLGPVGSRMLAEVFVGLLQGDPNSFVVQQPGWTPSLPAAQPGTFTMADLLRFADRHSPVINAIDDDDRREV